MPYLIVERASVIVERRKLDKDQITMGRGSGNDIVLDDPGIGSNLAVIAREPGGYVLTDQGSMAGITFGNERVSKLPLKNGMRFEAFPFSFVYEDEGGAEASAPDSRLEATMAMDLSAPGEGMQLVAVSGGFGPFSLKAGVNIVGRKPGLDITLDSKTVSKEHAHVIVIPGDVIVEDKGSANGTFVNRRRVSKEVVRHGDVIQFGSVEMRLVSESEERSADPMHATADIQLDGLLLGGALDQQAQAFGAEPAPGKGKPKGKVPAAAAAVAPAAVGAGAKAAAAPEKPKGKGGRVFRLAMIGCLTMVLLVLMVVVLLSGGGEPPPPVVDKGIELKLQQAKGILASGKDVDSGIKLIDEVIASTAPENVKTEAKTIKDQLLVKKRAPKAITEMTQEELRDEANKLVSRGKILSSVAYWERLVTLDPNWERCGNVYATLMYQLGLIYDGAGNREMAIQLWRRCQQVLPEAGAENVAHAKIRERLMAAGVTP